MTDPLETTPTHPPSWDSLQESIHSWLILRFGVNSPRDKDIWLFCIGAAMELERLAVGVLWIANGRPTPAFYEYEAKMTLGQAQQEIERRGLFDASIWQILKEVANLRNSVAHRQAIFVTAHSPVEGQPVGEYKGYHVFIYREGLAELIRDTDTAARTMYEWMAKHAPDLAEQAKQSGAHPPPP